MTKSEYIRSIDKNRLQTIVNSSSTIKQILNKIGIQDHTSYRRILYIKFKVDGIDLSEFKNKYKLWKDETNKKLKTSRKIPIEEIFVENSTYNNRNLLKKLLTENNLLIYECEKCKIDGEWCGETLVLQLDHKNGIPNDNRVENLRFLCPNCHSQTDTYSGKNIKFNKIKDKFYCTSCRCETRGYSNICVKCKSDNQRKFQISKEELEKLIQEYPMTTIGKMFGVSDVAIRKRCRLLDVDLNIRKFKRSK